MNPIVSLLIKQLPDLLPIIKSLLKKTPASRVEVDNGRLLTLEQSLQLLAERSDYLEAKLKRIRLLMFVTGLLSVVALIVVLVRT